MKKEIILVSDLWGKRKADWLTNFERILLPSYDIKFYDACTLADIDNTIQDEKTRHNLFIHHGIQKATQKLLTLESSEKIYIGCSIGGVILWKAGLLGLRIEQLITISSTRLRKETTKPKCPIQMYFGALDTNNPNLAWFKRMKSPYKIIEAHIHDLYKDEIVVAEILNNLT